MMRKKLIKELFGINDTEFDEMIANAEGFFNGFKYDVDEESNNDEEYDHNYFSSVKKEYNNGKLLKKREKEYIDGECTKDIEFDATKSLGTDDVKKEEKPCKCTHRAHLYHVLKEENVTLKNQVDDMTHYIDSLNDKIKELEKKNSELTNLVNKVKNCF